mmetsp:Transcript_40580/g.101950  ORF Transcript_40580/g.101950 Transcript_40580/m.101950 type:complete len:405 (-) Transcript_40580:15-1229(-)
MKSFDAFGRPVQEFQVKTTFGGYLSLCSLALVAILFITELGYFLQKETKDKMIIDQGQDQKYLNMTVDVTFPQAACSVVGLNLIDPKRANVMHVGTEIYKTRLSRQGKPMGIKVRDSLANVATNTYELIESGLATAGVRTTHATTHLRCASCFQSHTDEDDCCFTCDDVRREFRTRGLDDHPKDYVFSQCEAEEAYRKVQPEVGEGCRIEARLHIRKVPATLHIGVSRHFKEKLWRVANWTDSVLSMDFDHEINSLSFGPEFPGLVHVLNGRKKNFHSGEHSEHYQYDVHVIPTRFLEEGYAEVSSHQYSVTEYTKVVNTRDNYQDAVVTGFWMNYDFTPFEVQVTKSRKSMWHFLTECCAILGGIFAFTGMLDNFAYALNKSLNTGRRSGSRGNIEMTQSLRE